MGGSDMDSNHKKPPMSELRIDVSTLKSIDARRRIG
jgi:hypothetical protein